MKREGGADGRHDLVQAPDARQAHWVVPRVQDEADLPHVFHHHADVEHVRIDAVLADAKEVDPQVEHARLERVQLGMLIHSVEQAGERARLRVAYEQRGTVHGKSATGGALPAVLLAHRAPVFSCELADDVRDTVRRVAVSDAVLCDELVQELQRHTEREVPWQAVPAGPAQAGRLSRSRARGFRDAAMALCLARRRFRGRLSCATGRTR
mmetsp:Transcript_11945/g.31210  ORF Transcript_11945/g.31210 Transcript_11945/m.31210 type:complete len:210 (+) Transcript_11945:96-725(+)